MAVRLYPGSQCANGRRAYHHTTILFSFFSDNRPPTRFYWKRKQAFYVHEAQYQKRNELIEQYQDEYIVTHIPTQKTHQELGTS
jgi:hypothetical protein